MQRHVALVADRAIGARHYAQHVGEVFGPHHHLILDLGRFGADDLRRRADHDFGQFGIVQQNVEDISDIAFDFDLMGGGEPGA